MLKALIYFPLLMLGSVISQQFLNKADSTIIWIIMILLSSITMFFLIYFIKGLLIGFKVNRCRLWVPLFIICTFVTCMLPFAISFHLISGYVREFSEATDKKVTWRLSGVFCLYVYSRYQFLTDNCPKFLLSFYIAGYRLSVLLLQRYYRN